MALVAGAIGPKDVLAQSRSAVIGEIVVDGVQRIEPDTVRSYLLVQEGDVIDPSRIDRSLKSLYATGLFDDVSIRQQGNRLIVTVVENPVINRIAFEGNKRIDDETLQSEVTLRPRIIYTRVKVASDVERILNIYRRTGRFGATVEPKVIRLAQNRVDLAFEISEGDDTEIASIRFVGNRAYSDSRLREVVRTKETRWYRFFSGDDTYDPERLTLDRELMRRFYLSEGYTDFRVVSAVAELTPNREHFFITFTINEGERYAFGTVETRVRLRDLNPEDLATAIEIEQGEWYDAETLDTTIDSLKDAVGDLGYAFVDVRPRINRNREEKTIDITFEVGEGPRVFVERIDITGNVRTVDEVIRREFRLIEGDAFNSAKLRRSRQRIQNLGFFETVSVEEEPGSAADKAVIRVHVEEKSTGSLNVGAGFSTTNGALFTVGIEERNLLGRGQRLKLNTVVAQKKSEVDLGFTEPYFLDREIAAGFDVFRTTSDLQDESSFDRQVTGGRLRAGYPITEDWRQSWRYTLQETQIENVDSNASAVIRLEEGKSILNEVSHTISYDVRDNRFAPTEGLVAQFTTDVAGLVGDSQHMRNRVTVAKFFPLLDQWVLSLSGSAGYIVPLGKDIRISERFFVGGDDVRGFESGGIGPRDRATDDALGGEWTYTGSAEMQFPIGLPNELGISARVFTDMGSSGSLESSGFVIDDTGSLRLSVGYGVSWLSPLGLIGVDFGYPILKEDFDKEETVRVNFGTRF